jgi:hypothetical protein
MLNTRQSRNSSNGEWEPMADKVEGDTREMEMEGAERRNDVNMSETTAEIENDAAANNDSFNLVHCCQVRGMDHGSAADRPGLKPRFCTFLEAARGKRENRNELPGE